MCKLVKIIWILHRGFTRSQKQLKWVLLRGVYAVWALAISQTPPRKYSFLVVCDLYVNWAVWAVPLSQFQAMRIISGTSRHPRDVTSSLPNFPVAQFFSVVHFCCCPIFPCPFSVAFFRCRFYLLPSVMTVGVIRRRKPCLLMPASSPACWRRWIRWNCGRSLVNKPLMNSAWITQLYRESTTYTNAKKTPVHPSNRSHAHNAGKTFDFPLQPTISSLLIHYKPLDTGVRNPSQDDKITKKSYSSCLFTFCFDRLVLRRWAFTNKYSMDSPTPKACERNVCRKRSSARQKIGWVGAERWAGVTVTVTLPLQFHSSAICLHHRRTLVGPTL